jgi:hypothetical protein
VSVKLDQNPTRLLTSRECAKLIGGQLGSLFQVALPEDIHTALLWWVENWDKIAPCFQQVIEYANAENWPEPKGIEFP